MYWASKFTSTWLTLLMLLYRAFGRNPHTLKLLGEVLTVSQTLILNATYEPLGVVSERRALILVLNARAVSVEDSDRILTYARGSITLPAVIKLNTIAVPTASFSPNVLQPSGSNYTPSSGSNQIDVVTLVAFDNSQALVVNSKRFI